MAERSALTTPVSFAIAPYEFAAAARLERELGMSHVAAQVLVRRGLVDPAAAREFLAAAEEHPPEALARLPEVVDRLLAHVAARSRITVHGDYDVDGVCSTAILVRALRALGADVDWYLPDRLADGYGLTPATVERLARRGTRLLVTVDCGITAVDEVALARARGLEVIVTDHHAPRADGRLPDALVLHPRLGGHACPDLCAAGVAHKLAAGLHAAAGSDPAAAEEDLDLVALATVADVVPLRGENRRLVRAGLRALATTRKPGLRALMAVSGTDPGGLDTTAIGFRLAPRLNAAGRLYRADAALELLLTQDLERARTVAAELEAYNAERRDVETRILFAAEALVAQAGPAPAYVLAAEGWHPGVIGIVAARLVERHFRPTVLVALDGDTGTGSGRSVPAFDLLAGLEAGAGALLRYGGHRAAAGLTIARDRVDVFRAAFVAHAAAVLRPDDLVPQERIDAVVPGDILRLDLAEELDRLGPFGAGNPPVSLLVPAAILSDPRPMGEGRHFSCTLTAGGARSRAVAFGAGSRLPPPADGPVDAAVRLEVNRWNGTEEPRLVLRRLRGAGHRPIDVMGEPDPFLAGVLAEIDAPLEPWPPPPRAPGDSRRALRDVRGSGIAGVLADLVATGEPVLAVCAHAPHRARRLRERLGGFCVCSWSALELQPQIADRFAHVVAVDPPAHAHRRDLLAGGGAGGGWAHLAWGEPELRFAQQIHEWEHALRAPLADLYRAVRAAGGGGGEALEALLRGGGPQPRTAALAGRLVRILAELGLVHLERTRPTLTVVETTGRRALEQSAAFRVYERRREDGLRYLTETTRAAA